MLMQNFKSAADLGITEPQMEGLISVLGMLERAEFKHTHSFNAEFGFNMANHFAKPHPGTGGCGTVGCIAGWAEHFAGLTKGDFLDGARGELAKLFSGGNCPNLVTTDQAATALRSYLTTGDARWDLAVA